MTGSICSASGAEIFPFEPWRGGAPTIEDIAHALSNICRFGGHTREFYSVAQHSVAVSLRVPAELRVPALLHDAAEAYLGDIPRPLKTQFELHEYCDAESYLLECIFRQLRVPWPSDEAWTRIKQADNEMLDIEQRDLMPDTDWWEKKPLPHEPTITPMLPTDARLWFLMQWKALPAPVSP